MSNPRTARLIDYLWPDGDDPTTPAVYALLDGARDQRIAPQVRLSRTEYCCLYSGKCTGHLQNAAPYLVHLARDGQFTRTLFDQGWGLSWGLFTVVPPDVSLKQQREHFRSLLRVRDENGRKLAFRFYDPRVLRVYLPTCTGEEAKQFFGPVPRILVEDEDAQGMLEFRRVKNGVKSSMVSIDKLTL